MIKHTLIFLFFILFSCKVFSQTDSIKTNQNFLISFTSFYSSNLINFHEQGYEDLYLITSHFSFEIDSLMSKLSKRKFSTVEQIINIIKQYYSVYKITVDTNNIKVLNYISNSMNFKTGYLFSLDKKVRRYGTVYGYIIRRTPLGKMIKYRIIENKCGDFSTECAVVIDSIGSVSK